MSVEHLSIALKQRPSKSSAKFVLVVMANIADEHGVCWPSQKYLSEATGQDIKTIKANMQRLISEGFISDTGDRRGKTGQITVYRLENGSSPKTGQLNETENGLVDDGKGSVFPDKGARFSLERGPKTDYGHDTYTKTNTAAAARTREEQDLTSALSRAGWPLHKINQDVKVITMVRGWAQSGVTVADLDLAIGLMRDRFRDDGGLANSPLYLRDIAADAAKARRGGQDAASRGVRREGGGQSASSLAWGATTEALAGEVDRSAVGEDARAIPSQVGQRISDW